MQQFHRRVAGKGRTTRKQVVKNRAETVHIRRSSDAARVGRLFRRHVVWRAENGEGLGEIALALQPFRESEIAHVRFAGGIKEHISRLQITMKDSVLVGESDRTRQLRNQRCGFARLVTVFVDLC